MIARVKVFLLGVVGVVGVVVVVAAAAAAVCGRGGDSETRSPERRPLHIKVQVSALPSIQCPY